VVLYSCTTTAAYVLSIFGSNILSFLHAIS